MNTSVWKNIFIIIGIVALVMIFGFASGQTITPDENPEDNGDQQTDLLPQLNPWIAIGSAALGVFLSFIIPTLAEYQKTIQGKIAENTAITSEIRVKALSNAAKKYVITAVQSFLIAFVVIAVLLNQGPLHYWYEAVIAGYTFDATIQKVKA